MSFRKFSTVLFWLLLTVAQPAVALVPAPETLREDAIRYENGVGVTQDYTRAYRLYCLAALQGDSEAANRLGWMHLKGTGLTADAPRAAGWFQQAVNSGYADAGKALVDQLDQVSPVDDPGCPRVEPKPDRAKIATWVRLLEPYYNVSAALVLAIIKVESNFNARAKSPKDARGLMQLIPATARRFDVEDVWDPIENLKGGMAYLHWLNDYFSGNIRMSLAAYNAGEAAVERYGGIPPYQETRKYVERIARIYNNYIRLRNGLRKPTSRTAGTRIRTKRQQARALNERALSREYISPASIN